MITLEYVIRCNNVNLSDLSLELIPMIKWGEILTAPSHPVLKQVSLVNAEDKAETSVELESDPACWFLH